MEQCSCRETDSSSLVTKSSRSLWNQNSHSQQPVKYPCPEPHQSNVGPYVIFLEDPLQYHPPIYKYNCHVVSFFTGFPLNFVSISLLTVRDTRPAHLIVFDLITRIIFGEERKLWMSLLWNIFPVPFNFFRPSPTYVHQHYSRKPAAYTCPTIWETKIRTHIKKKDCCSVYFNFYTFR